MKDQRRGSGVHLYRAGRWVFSFVGERTISAGEVRHVFNSMRGQTMRATSNRARPCPCGSGIDSWWENDAQGIPLCRVCQRCRAAKLARYRPEILSGYTQADVDEPIEPES